MTSMLSAELSATCNALGTYDKKTGKYLIDEYTLNTVKDLIRYLRRDGEEHEIRRHLGQTKVLQTDLIPMLIDHWENDELFDVTLRLLVNLTNPALLLYREEVPVERTARHNYLQILFHLQNYKEETFTKVDTWNVFAKKLAKTLEIDWSERDEDTGLVIERILILIRNVLHVPADLDRERRPENDASVHDQVLWGLNQSGILDILLYMSSENEKQYFMHILEIVSHLLREQNPSALADAALRRSGEEKLRDDQELLAMRASETKQRLHKIKQYSATRHSRFGGTYVVQNMKSISENELISFKPLTKLSCLDFSGSKKSKFVRPKNRRPVESGMLERRSAFAVRLFLKEFCIEFLNSSYNPLMRHAKDVLVRARAQQNDESYYLWALKFFMEFNRGHDFQVGLVSETMSVPMFHFVQQQMEKYCDMLKVEKKRPWPWVRRLHLGLRAYKELLRSLLAMGACAVADVRTSAEVLKSNIFYVLEYREFVLALFLGYDEAKMPRSYLVDLVETVHLFLKMLEHFCKKTGLVVQKKGRKKTKSKKKQRAAREARPRVAPQVTPWEEARPQLAAVLRRGAHAQPPCDAAAPLQRQREDCMKNIQRCMREYKFEDAVGMFRAARELWPEEGIFGESGIAEDEELEMLETIYNADLGVESIPETNESTDETQEQDSGEDEEEEEEDRTAAVVETDFDFLEFVRRLCQPRVVSACALVLRCGTETPRAAHCALKLLHRVARDCAQAPLLFQASLFLVFQHALARADADQHTQELQKFAVYILRQFAAAAANEPKLFIELLFWKTPKDALEIVHGYNKYSDQRDKAAKGAWSEEQEDELRQLFAENQANPENDQDVIDWILDNLVQPGRTRRGVLAKLRQLGLIFKAPTKRANKERARLGKAADAEPDDDDQRSGSPPAAKTKNSARKKSKKKEGKQNVGSSEKTVRRPLELGANQIARLLVGAVAHGFSEALSWLAENLEEVALDQEAEGYDPSAEGTPLVPISREAVEAMASPLFTEVLEGVGVAPPADEQETYWRIPSGLHFETIRTRCEMILKAINGELVAGEASDDDDDDLFGRLRDMRAQAAEGGAASAKGGSGRKRGRGPPRKLRRIQEADVADKADEVDKANEADEADEANNADEAGDPLRREAHDDESLPRDDGDSDDDVLRRRSSKKRRLVLDDDSD